MKFEMHHVAKFHQNRLNCGRDMAIFTFFKMAAAAILDSASLLKTLKGDKMSPGRFPYSKNTMVYHGITIVLPW